MKNKNKRTVRPKLRFPEFQDEPGWEAQPLGSVSQFVKKKMPLHQLNLDTYVSTENISPDYGGIEQASKLPPNGSATEYKPDDILIANIRPYLKKVWRSNRSGGASNDVIVIRPKAVLRKDYLPMVIANDTFINYVMKTAKGVKMPRGDIASMKEYVVYYPTPPEQKKIAECLSSLDRLITAEGRALEALKTHKRGLMQQLFPQPGQTQPRLRFPEFRDKGEWVNKLLDELGERGSGHTPNKKKPEYYNGGIKWVSLADSKRLDQGLISETEIEISEQGLNNSSAVLHPAGTVILSRDAGVGKSAVLAEKMAVSQHFIVWKCNSKNLFNWFFYYLLQRLKPLFEEIATGSTIKTIGLPFFKTLRITIPKVEEQHRIADCLTALDTQITAQAAKIETLKTHKRGLMQQLFPSPEEQ